MKQPMFVCIGGEVRGSDGTQRYVGPERLWSFYNVKQENCVFVENEEEYQKHYAHMHMVPLRASTTNNYSTDDSFTSLVHQIDTMTTALQETKGLLAKLS